MAVSIDARVGQREIDAAKEGGDADIEGVTSKQGRPVADAEQQITFGGYPNQIGPSLLANQGLINQEQNVVDIIDSLHPDFVANASPEELDYAIAVAQGKAKYEEGVLSGPTVSRQPPWAGSRTQTTGTGPTYEEDVAFSENTIKQGQDLIAWFEKEIEKSKAKLKDMQRWHTSPARAEATLGPPLPLVGGGGDVGAYIEQQQMGMGPPLGGGNMPAYSGTPTFVEDESAWGAGDYLGAPTFVEDESAWGAGSYQPTINVDDQPLGQAIASTGHPDWGMSSTPMNPPIAVRRADGTVEMMEMPVTQSQVPLIDVPKDIKTTKKDTKKTNYGAWTGKLNKLTKDQNNKNFNTFQKAWMSDLKNDPVFVEHFEKVEQLGGHIKAAFTPSYMREYQRIQGLYNELRQDDAYIRAYGATVGTNPVLGGLAQAVSKGIGMFGKWGTNMTQSKGLGSSETYKDTKARIASGENQGGDAEVVYDPREKVEGGFWGLLNFAKEHKNIFGTLSGDALWKLVQDEDDFWKFYEDALNA